VLARTVGGSRGGLAWFTCLPQLALAVKVARAETVAAAAPQQRKPHAELREERRKVRDDQGSEARGCSGQRDGRGGGGVLAGAEGHGSGNGTNLRFGMQNCGGGRGETGAAGGFAAETGGEGRRLGARMASTVAASHVTFKKSSATS
jgi:hypothetical protein